MKKWIPLLFILICMALIYYTGLYRSLDYETLRYHHVELTEYVNTHPLLTPLMFIGSYIVVAALCIPGGLLLNLVGGFLFKQPWAFFYVLIGATIGSTLIFLAAKTAVGDFLRKKAGPRLTKMEKGFNRNAVSYLLFLRFVPLVPFWIVNLAPAFFNVRLFTYVWTTFVGIAPGAFVTTEAGRGLGVIFETSDTFSIDLIFNKTLTISLILLAILALVPIAYKKWKKKRNL